MKKKIMAALIAALCCMSTVPCTPLAVTAESSSAEATADNYGFDINGTQKLTLADVAELSKKGYELSLHDFEPYSAKWYINDISCAATFAIAVKILPTISAFSAVIAAAPEMCCFGTNR